MYTYMCTYNKEFQIIVYIERYNGEKRQKVSSDTLNAQRLHVYTANF